MLSDLQERISGLEEDAPYEDAKSISTIWQKEQEEKGLKASDRTQFPTGESKNTATLRIVNTLTQIGTEHVGKTVVVITHGYVLSLFARKHLDSAFPRFRWGDVAEVIFHPETHSFTSQRYTPNKEMLVP